MNDQNDFQDLDARAAAAATDLRAAAGSRPRPAFDPERSPAIPKPGRPGRPPSGAPPHPGGRGRRRRAGGGRGDLGGRPPRRRSTEPGHHHHRRAAPLRARLAARRASRWPVPARTTGSEQPGRRIGAGRWRSTDRRRTSRRWASPCSGLRSRRPRRGADPFEVGGVEAYAFDDQGFGPERCSSVDGTGGARPQPDPGARRAGAPARRCPDRRRVGRARRGGAARGLVRARRGAVGDRPDQPRGRPSARWAGLLRGLPVGRADRRGLG